MSGSLTLNLQAALLRNLWLALQSYLQVLSVNRIIFPHDCLAGSTDFQLPSQWETQAHPCALHPCPDTSQVSTDSSRELGRRTKVFLDSSRVCCEDEQGTCGLSHSWSRQCHKAFLSRSPDQSHLTESADTELPCSSCERRADCTTQQGLRETETVILQVWAISFSYSCKAIILSKTISFQKDVHSKNSTTFRRDELPFHGVFFASVSSRGQNPKLWEFSISTLNWFLSYRKDYADLTAGDAETTAASAHKTKTHLSNSLSLT